MPSHCTTNPDGSITVSFTFETGASMMQSERNLQNAANTALAQATGKCMERFDTDGSPLLIGGRRFTSKGKLSKKYQTPYGAESVARHVYQSSKGGTTFCPLEQEARIVRTASPLMARQTASKYANGDGSAAVRDFSEHGRKVARTYVMELAGDVASIAAQKEEHWTYPVEVPNGEKVSTVAVGVDGAYALMIKGEGWRQVMVGTIALFNSQGERLHTTYVGAAPEYGKTTFFERMERELGVIRKGCPSARYVGVADGAPDHWPWMEKETTWQVIDFWHASEYLAGISETMGKHQGQSQEAWMQEACHRLKHEAGGAKALTKEMEAHLESGEGNKAARESLKKAVSYFRNNGDRMKYDVYQAMGLPIGSGVTEAACKCVAKARLCGSGMRWDTKGSGEVLALRTMVKTAGRWDKFWGKVEQYGFERITRPHREKREK